MQPIIEAQRLRGADFAAELRAHLLQGVVVSTSRIFLMGRPCPKGADVSDLSRSWPVAECNSWFVWVGVGDARELIAAMPYPLPWIGWHRQGRLWKENHWLKAETFLKRFK